MRKNFGQQSYFMPLPVMIIGSYDKDNHPNAMNAAWGGIHDTNEIFVCLASDHKTSANIKIHNEFTVSFANSSHVKEADYLGLASGNDENKIEKANLHPIKSEFVNAPYFEEFEISLDCKVKDLKDDGQTIYLVADIINVSVDDSILLKGRLDLSKLDVLCFEPFTNSYVKMGELVDKAFNAGLEIKSK